MRLIFNLLSYFKTAKFALRLHSGVRAVHYSKNSNMADSYKDFGPLVGAIDQGTSSSRFLVSQKN